MNKEQEVFAKEISEMLTDMYNRGFADCEAAAKLAIEAGIKKAMALEREACFELVYNYEDTYHHFGLCKRAAELIKKRGEE
jgi:hypothetical protein